jgi:putative ATPase
MIFWGPPGSGKTTLARMIAEKTSHPFVQFSAVVSGIKDVKAAIEQARWKKTQDGKGTILFVDEIHRFNRAQQDAFLPHIEDGTVILVGATTENPSFEVNRALLSRCRVFPLRALEPEELETLIERAAKREGWRLEEGVPALLAEIGAGDARVALNLLEVSALAAGVSPVDREIVGQAAQGRTIAYDKNRDGHYDTISAFIKSMRGSDPDAALFWLAKMIGAGEDPLFIVRRMVIFASEDIGNAEPRALMIANAVRETVSFVGMPESSYALAQGVIYLATAPKSRSAGDALLRAKEDVEKHPNDPVPLPLRNAVTPLMKELGYGEGDAHVHRPDSVEGNGYYRPGSAGFETMIRKWMEEGKRS